MFPGDRVNIRNCLPNMIHIDLIGEVVSIGIGDNENLVIRVKNTSDYSPDAFLIDTSALRVDSDYEIIVDYPQNMWNLCATYKYTITDHLIDGDANDGSHLITLIPYVEYIDDGIALHSKSHPKVYSIREDADISNEALKTMIYKAIDAGVSDSNLQYIDMQRDTRLINMQLQLYRDTWINRPKSIEELLMKLVGATDFDGRNLHFEPCMALMVLKSVGYLSLIGLEDEAKKFIEDTNATLIKLMHERDTLET